MPVLLVRYDGQWNGSATAESGRCKPAVVTLTVLDRTVEGQARFELDTHNIHGTVSADGAFGATIGFQHLTGNFIEDVFEGTFRSLTVSGKWFSSTRSSCRSPWLDSSRLPGRARDTTYFFASFRSVRSCPFNGHPRINCLSANIRLRQSQSMAFQSLP